MIILASKQFYDLTYFTDDINVLYSILITNRIRLSKHVEYDTNRHNGPMDKSVSFSRSLLAQPKRNRAKWTYGIILDGEKLTDRYSFVPISYAGVAIERGNTLYIEYIIVPKFGRCTLKLFDRKAFTISRDLAIYIINNGDFSNYTLNTDTDDYEYYIEDRRIAAPIDHILTNDQYAEITKSQPLNEYEERVWNHSSGDRLIVKGEYKYIDISKCVKGVVFPCDCDDSEINMVNKILKDVFDFNGNLEDLLSSSYKYTVTCDIKDGFYIIRTNTSI